MAKKQELDFTDPHLLATLLSLAVSVPVFLYFLYQMVVNAHDWDTAFDEDGQMYSQKARHGERLAALKKRATRPTTAEGGEMNAASPKPTTVDTPPKGVQPDIVLRKRKVSEDDDNTIIPEKDTPVKAEHLKAE